MSRPCYWPIRRAPNRTEPTLAEAGFDLKQLRGVLSEHLKSYAAQDTPGAWANGSSDRKRFSDTTPVPLRRVGPKRTRGTLGADDFTNNHFLRMVAGFNKARRTGKFPKVY